MSTTPSGVTNPSPTNAEDTTFPLMTLPAELRLVIYRHYFDILTRSKLEAGTALPCLGVDALSLIHSNSQVRREAAPIFYKECIGNAGFAQTPYWRLVASDFDDMVARLKTFSVSLAQNAPDAIVEILVHTVLDRATVVDAETKIRFIKYRRLYEERTERFAKVLLRYIGRNINQLSLGEQGEDAIQDGRFTDLAESFDTNGVIGRFTVTRGWFDRLCVVGPIGELDWSGLSS
jgi:hypothetical protein